MNQTLGELAESKLPQELHKKFDYALPQEWVDFMQRTLVEDPRGQFVWLYDEEGAIFGRPYPLTDAARVMLHWYNKEAGTLYPSEWLV